MQFRHVLEVHSVKAGDHHDRQAERGQNGQDFNDPIDFHLLKIEVNLKDVGQGFTVIFREVADSFQPIQQIAVVGKQMRPD